MPELGETLEVVEDLEEGLEAEVNLETEDIPEIQEVIKAIGRDHMAAVLIGQDHMEEEAVHPETGRDRMEEGIHPEMGQGLMGKEEVVRQDLEDPSSQEDVTNRNQKLFNP